MSLNIVELLDPALDAVADALVAKYGKADIHTGERDDENGQGIPREAVDELTEVVVTFAAELAQAWLDAGSERDVTFEELDGPVRNHFAGWVPVGNDDALTDTPEYKKQAHDDALGQATITGVTPDELVASHKRYDNKFLGREVK